MLAQDGRWFGYCVKLASNLAVVPGGLAYPKACPVPLSLGLSSKGKSSASVQEFGFISVTVVLVLLCLVELTSQTLLQKGPQSLHSCSVHYWLIHEGS